MENYIKFDKSQLINLEYSLTREFIRSNRAGSYASSTIINCNTRKYHGLLVAPMDELDGQKHVLLSALDETVIQHDKEFHLGVRKYPDVYHTGHKYIRDFHTDPIPTIIYRVGGVVLQKETLLAEDETSVLVRYKLLEANSSTKIKLHPFLAFRQTHQLSKANMDVNSRFSEIPYGIKTRMYDAYPMLHMQLSKQNEYVHAPDWYHDIEYIREKERGYPCHEDLFVPGYFEFPIKKGESVVFCCSLDEQNIRNLKTKFTREVKKRIPRTTFENCLVNSAQQFFVHKEDKTFVTAGFPWFDVWGRDTFIALPGLTLPSGDLKTFRNVLDSMSLNLNGALFKNMGIHDDADLNSVDAPLWYFWAVQQYAYASHQYKRVWEDYGPHMRKILEGYKQGTKYNIKVHENGLVYAGFPGKALTWMDAVVNGQPVTPRMGYDVEINALWYNAIQFMLELARRHEDDEFVNQWKDMPEKVAKSFVEVFWSDEKQYLADYANPFQKDSKGMYRDWAVRPNQVFATSLPYSLVSDDIKHKVLLKVEKELLTPRGLRTLSPNSPDYKNIYEGDQAQRDSSYHQGTVWPWLLGHYAEAYLKLHEKSGKNAVERIYKAFEEEMTKNGIGSISEIYDGNPPHDGKGAISQAWSVAEVLRIKYMLDALV